MQKVPVLVDPSTSHTYRLRFTFNISESQARVEEVESLKAQMSDLQKRYQDAVQVRIVITTGYITEHRMKVAGNNISWLFRRVFKNSPLP